MCNKLRSKVLFTMLITAMTTGVLTGCGNNGQGASDETLASAGTTEGIKSTESEEGDGSKAEVITLDVAYKKNTLTKDLKENPVFQQVEEEVGVDIQWTYYGDTDWDDQRALLLASGDLPEVMFGDGFRAEDIMNSIEYFVPLEDYIEEYCPNIKAAFEKNPEMKKRVTATDGHIYYLPNRQPCMPNTQDAYFINQKWLDNLGLEMPTTTDELYNVLKAFKEQDANGNGDPDDEIPITAQATQGRGYDLIEGYLPFFGLIDNMSEHKVMVKDGKVSYTAIDEGLKEAVKFFHKLYQEGILDQEAFTQDYSMMQAKFQNIGDCIVGMGTAWVPSAIVSSEHLDEYTTLLPVKGPQNTTYVRYNPEIYNVADVQFSITQECKNPVAAMKWADALYDEEISIQTFFGPEGLCVEKTDDNKYQVLEPQDGLSGDIWTWTNAPKSNGPKYVSEETESKIILPDTSNEAVKLKINEQYQPYISEEYYPRFMFNEDVVDQIVGYKADMEPYRDEQIANWIVGGGVEEEWDAYVEKMNQLGAQEYVQILQEEYDHYYGK
ncbi:MAG: extracellular solute-binding protein [Cellulosilyticum sp.]|nr:extracellular solute-binding protein [Cellulosilyticum sp.]